MDIKDLSFENGSIYIKRKISKEDFKKAFVNVKTKYKKYLTNFFEKYCNDTACILTLTTYLMMLKGYLYSTNVNIQNDFTVTKDDNYIYAKFSIEKFYDRNFTEFTEEQLRFIVNNKLEDLEIEVLLGNFAALETDEELKNKVEIMLSTLVNVDDIIQNYKEQIKNGIEIKSSKIDSEILKRLYAEFSISVIKDVLKNDKEYLEI